MSIITVSRGSYSQGSTIATGLAARLGYGCIGREVLIEASKEFNIPEIKLVRAIENAPSFLERFTYGKEKYIAYIQAAILKQLRKDNMIYHGFAGHFFVRGIPHALKVRIIADPDERAHREMERERISEKDALSRIKSIDEERRKWSLHLYGIDTADAALYDLVIHIAKITVDDAVDLITDVVRRKNFQTTPESQRAMDDLALAAEVRVALVNLKPDVEVMVQEGITQVVVKAAEYQNSAFVENLEKTAKEVPGVKEVKFQVRARDSYTE